MKIISNTITKFSLIFLLSMASCQRQKTPFEASIYLSGSNSSELEFVINHYAKVGDKEKSNAAIFLIENMIDKYSLVEGPNTENKDSIIGYLSNIQDSCSWDPHLSKLANNIDSILDKYPQEYILQKDLEVINAKTLIQNIDNAFNVWNLSEWKSNYSFIEFCNYVSPHKVGIEAYEDWRTKALSDETLKEDSLRKYGEIYDYAYDLAKHSFTIYNIGMDKYPYPLRFSDMKNIKSGSCVHIAYMIMFYNRSRGIPVAYDIIPAWANRSGAHMFCSVILPNSRSKGIYFNTNNDFQYKPSKIYRETYQIQPKLKPAFRERIPSFFLNRNIIDVTDQYDMPLSSFTIDVPTNLRVNYVYLATFNNKNWIPITYSENRESQAVFKNMARGVLPKGNDRMIKYINQGNGIVYLPVCYMIHQEEAIASPFILDTLGNIRSLKPSIQEENVRLYRKYPQNLKFEKSAKSMVGGIFEASNTSDFSSSTVLCSIKTSQSHPLEVIKTNTDTQFRYLRFTPPKDKEVSIAELQFFNNTGVQIMGKPIGKSNLTVFDGDLLTWAYKAADKVEHFIFDFGSQKSVSEIKFSARTDDNVVMKGEEYELFYWNGEWISLGSKIANEYFLDYNVPMNALLLLRNHTKGIEERIFIIENGIQRWF